MIVQMTAWRSLEVKQTCACSDIHSKWIIRMLFGYSLPPPPFFENWAKGYLKISKNFGDFRSKHLLYSTNSRVEISQKFSAAQNWFIHWQSWWALYITWKYLNSAVSEPISPEQKINHDWITLFQIWFSLDQRWFSQDQQWFALNQHFSALKAHFLLAKIISVKQSCFRAIFSKSALIQKKSALIHTFLELERLSLKQSCSALNSVD